MGPVECLAPRRLLAAVACAVSIGIYIREFLKRKHVTAAMSSASPLRFAVSGYSPAVSYHEVDLSLGTSRLVASTEVGENPTFLARGGGGGGGGGVMYAILEVDGGRTVAFAPPSSPGAPPSPLGDVSSGGAGPCHVALDPSGAHVLRCAAAPPSHSCGDGRARTPARARAPADAAAARTTDRDMCPWRAWGLAGCLVAQRRPPCTARATTRTRWCSRLTADSCSCPASVRD